jgi:hypothetical protein
MYKFDHILSRLLMVRLQQEGDEGLYVKHMLVKALWDDVENRSKKLGVKFQFKICDPL